MHWAGHLAAALILALAGIPALAADKTDLHAEMAALQRDDTRLQSIGWRIARANAALCPDPQPAVGLLPLDVRSFKDPVAIRRALGLAGDFAVGATALNSPAALAGALTGDEILAIENVELAALPDVPANSFARLTALVSRIDAELVRSGKLALTLRTPGSATTRQVKVTAEAACRSTFELLTGGDQAAADGTRVVISRRFLQGTGNDDEAAFVVGHELAHNILRHRALLDKIGRTPENFRQTERAADRLALWLMTNAGYDSSSAAQFMQRWARRRGPVIFRESTHDGWKTRQRTIAAELAVLNAVAAKPEPPSRDWREHFPR